MKLFTVYFGTDIQGRDVVRDEDFAAFLQVSVDSRFAGYSVTEKRGFWQGVVETTYCLEIMSDESQAEEIYALAKEYAIRFRQECVLVQVVDASAEYIILP